MVCQGSDALYALDALSENSEVQVEIEFRILAAEENLVVVLVPLGNAGHGDEGL